MLESRTVATVGGGDLVLGDSPVDGVLHGWVQEPDGELGSRHSFMLGASSARAMLGALRTREPLSDVGTFAGTLRMTWVRDLVTIWFYNWGQSEPDFACQLREGAIETAIEALSEACEGSEADPEFEIGYRLGLDAGRAR